MSATPRRLALAALLAGTGLLAVGCRAEPDADDAPPADATEAVAAPPSTPTAVRRRLPTPTPTVDPAEQPLYPSEHDALPGIPVPLGARVVEVVAATEDADARVDFALPDDVTEDDVTAWFREQMPEHGWAESEERDGAVVFLHTEELSARHADEGLERTAMVLFETLSEEADFSVLAEAAKP